MNLLPKSHKEFSQKEYWDSFFKKRGQKAFEWYGEYPELCEYLHKYIKFKEEVLIVGCGNSHLGNDMYDVGYKNITSIDISQVAIRQMMNANGKKRPEMKFQCMDATKTSFDNETFNAIIDKGTLDALMPDTTEETLKLIDSYFTEMLRVLKVGGRFICISLLQEHILKTIAKYFPQNNCMLRIVRTYEPEKKAAESGENSMPVFLIVCTKFKQLPCAILEMNLGASEKMKRIAKEQDLIDNILMVQKAALVCSGLQKTTVQDDISLDLFRPNEDRPRYTIFVVDITPSLKNMQYAAFIVPQGRESEWLFSRREGRKKLASISKSNRLAVVHLLRDQIFENLDTVKEELQESIRNFAPANLGKEKILFLSIGSDVGERKIVFKGNSKFSGDYVVEDVTIDDSKFRRLYYLQSQLVIQSEAKFKQGKTRNGNLKEVLDLTYLTCEHHNYISRLIHLATIDLDQSKCLIIGLGGGGLCSFLKKFLPKVSVTAVDIDPDMLEVATKWFGLETDKNLQAIITNGLDYLKQNEQKFNCIVFDVDNKDTTIGMSCPPKDFIDEHTLQDVSKSLEKSGLFIVNVVLRDINLRSDVITKLKTTFKFVMSYKLEEDLNEIFFCYVDDISSDLLKQKYVKSTEVINKFFKQHKNVDLINNNISLNIC